MPIIADAVGRFTVIGSIASQDVVNVVDVRYNTDTGQTRAEAAEGIAGDILNNWTDHVLPLLCNEYTAFEVRWVDLDSASGSTGAVTQTSAQTWPAAGSATGDPAPNNVYAKMVKVLQGKNRTQRNGTLRLSGIPRGFLALTNANELTADARTALAAGFEQLKDGINGGVGATERNIVVVHTIGGVATGSSIVSTYSPALGVGTIRRRMPGYGS